MTDLMGYADAVSVAPGQRIGFKVSCIGAATYRARIVRLLSPETGPNGPPFRFEPVDPPLDLHLPGREQALRCGSWAIVPPHQLIAGLRSFTIQAMIWPTTPGRHRQSIMGTFSEANGTGFGLMLNRSGALELRLGRGSSSVTIVSGMKKLLSRKWYFVAASYDAATGTARLHHHLVADHTLAATQHEDISAPSPGFAPGPGPFLFAAWHEADTDGLDGERLQAGGHFNGKIDHPRLAARALNPTEMAELARDSIPPALATDVVAIWDFSRDISTEIIRDISPNRLDATTINLPARAMTGYNWDGSEMHWCHAPAQYGAIHFHDDDIVDARWTTDFSFTVPDTLRSGCFAALLEAEEARYHIPFFVRPAPGKPTAEIAYLASTATYTVYCNNVGRFKSSLAEIYHGRVTVLDTIDMLLLKYPQMGLSTYDRHSDGSGVCYSSRLRPTHNIRPTGRMWNYCVDMMIVDWLDRSGIPFDVITDEDLHLQGLDAIRPYRTIVTGSHPEYDSLDMLDSLQLWLRGGGRLMYMGGNGFYWRIAHHPTNPAIMEVRRAEGGTRAWDAEPGESYHSFSGEYGGLWRRNGRAPNALAGVGFISQGFDRSEPYRRTPASYDPRVGFIFDGVSEELLGNFGLMQNGAAGMEIDSADPTLGTPPHALVLASSFNHSNTYELTAEEVRIPSGMSDALLNPLIHADIVFFETQGGGAVFSTGSIAYAGSLSHNAFDNPIARLTTNVLRRFADPEPFTMPASTNTTTNPLPLLAGEGREGAAPPPPTSPSHPQGGSP